MVIVNGSSNLTTQEFDQLTNVEVTSDGISGTQILFAPDSNSQSGKLVLPNIEESFDTDWTATTYTVEIIADSNLHKFRNFIIYSLIRLIFFINRLI